MSTLTKFFLVSFAGLLLILLMNNCSSSENMNSCITAEVEEYYLPYPIGVTYLCGQSHCDSFTHKDDLKYSVDFGMPIGSVITAARSGEVVNFREDIIDGDMSFANFIVINHDDGTLGRYLHLTTNGVLKNLGDYVEVGA